jgi:hypothetical protein
MFCCFKIFNDYLIIDEYTLKLYLIIGCFLLTITIISVVFMSNNRSNLNLTHRVIISSYDPREKIGDKLLAQLIHNNENPNLPLNYQNFPLNHHGYLKADNKSRLVSIIRSSNIADRYKFGSSICNFYDKKTNQFPVVTTDMISVVLAAETIS